MAAKLPRQIREIREQVRQQLASGGPMLAGVLAGAIGLVISYLLKGLVPARPLGDPLPLVLSITQLTRGFIYFQWRGPLFHLLFAVSLGLLALVLLRVLSQRKPAYEGAVMAGRIAGIINVGVVALLAVDAVIVGFWYLLSGLVSVIISGYAAGLTASWWLRRGTDDE